MWAALCATHNKARVRARRSLGVILALVLPTSVLSLPEEALSLWPASDARQNVLLPPAVRSAVVEANLSQLVCEYVEHSSTADRMDTASNLPQESQAQIDHFRRAAQATATGVSATASFAPVLDGGRVWCPVPQATGSTPDVALVRVRNRDSGSFVVEFTVARPSPRLAAELRGSDRLMLNLGCGMFLKKERGWVNLDALVVPSGQGFYDWGQQDLMKVHHNLLRWRIQQGLGFVQPGSAAVVAISQVLHLFPSDIWEAITRAALRALRPGGVFRVEETDDRVWRFLLQDADAFDLVVAKVDANPSCSGVPTSNQGTEEQTCATDGGNEDGSNRHAAAAVVRVDGEMHQNQQVNWAVKLDPFSTTVTRVKDVLHVSHPLCVECAKGVNVDDELPSKCWFCHADSVGVFEIIKGGCSGEGVDCSRRAVPLVNITRAWL